MSRLVNLGSLCIDNVYGVQKIASPGETVASRSYEIFPGGKGLNQSLAAQMAGCVVSHVGCVGMDGLWLKEFLADKGVDVSHVRECSESTGHAVIQVDELGQNSIVIVGGTNRLISNDEIDVALHLAQEGWLLLQNEINDLDRILERSFKAGVSVALNVAPVDGREQDYPLDGLGMLIVNEIEAASLSLEADSTTSLNKLCARLPDTHVVLTQGSQGLLYGLGDERLVMEAIPVNAVDETAAGDSFIGYLMASFTAGDSIERSLRLGSTAGALTVTRAGAASSIPTKEEVDLFLSNQK